MSNQQLGTNTFTTAKWIVSATASDGTHTTIAAALTAASSGDTIFIRPGTYTENLTLKAGVNITANGGDGLSGNVIILGKATATGTGTFTISNVQLKTNSDFCLLVSGSSVTTVSLSGVYINASNNTGISYTTSNAASSVALYNCSLNLATTGIAYYSMSSTGALNSYRSDFENSGASTTASSNSAGSVGFFQCATAGAFSTSSTGVVSGVNSYFNTAAINTTAVLTAGTGSSNGFSSCSIASGSASSVSIGTGTTVTLESCSVNSSNTNVITGAGTLVYAGLTFPTSSKINTTTQTGGTLQGGLTQAPSAGFTGEQIKNNATSVSLSNSTYKTVTSISITPGIWDICAVGDILVTGASTNAQINISTSDNALTGTEGDAFVQFATTAVAGQGSGSIPGFRVTLTATTTYYCVMLCVFTTGTATANARISATRVG